MKIFIASFFLLLTSIIYSKTIIIRTYNLDSPTQRACAKTFVRMGHANSGETRPNKNTITFPITLDGVYYDKYKIRENKIFTFQNVEYGNNQEEINFLLGKTHTIYDHKFDLLCYGYEIPCCENTRIVWDVAVVEKKDSLDKINELRHQLEIWVQTFQWHTEENRPEMAAKAKREIRKIQKKLETMNPEDPTE